MSDDTTNLGNESPGIEEIPAISEPVPDRGMPEIVPTPIPATVPEPVTPPAQPVPAEPATPILPESAPVAVPPPKSAKYFITMALEAIQFRKRKKLDKIMKFVTERGSITNDQAEKLIHASDSTANRYLKTLVRQNRLKVTGEGNSRRYVLF